MLLLFCLPSTDISTHSLTRRLTAQERFFYYKLTYFNSQPHKEADETVSDTAAFIPNFNSQPHKEADETIEEAKAMYEISTHSLTRRLTAYSCNPHTGNIHFNSQPHKEADLHLLFFWKLKGISTHSLTRRLTYPSAFATSLPTFQLTASQGG